MTQLHTHNCKAEVVFQYDEYRDRRDILSDGHQNIKGSKEGFIVVLL